MKAHIEEILTHKNFSCEQTVSKAGRKNYILGIQTEDYDKAANPSNWPQGVNIERYSFRWPARNTEST